MSERDAAVRHFRPQSRYLLLAGVSLVLAGALGWSLFGPLRAGEPLTGTMVLTGESFFFGLSVAVALWFLRQAMARVILTSTAVELTMPLARRQRAEFGQLMSVSESGRGGNALIVLYHPRRADGMLDLDDVRSMVIPAVHAQEELRTELEARMPV